MIPRRALGLTACCLFALAALAGPGEAQVGHAYEFEWSSGEVPDDGYAPVNTTFDRTIVLSVRCTVPHGASALPRTFGVSADAPEEFATVTVSPDNLSVPLDPAACGSGEAVRRNVTVSILMGADVRAATNVQIRLTATAEDDRVAHFDWSERPEPVMQTEVELRENRFQAGPNSRLSIPVDIRTEGNTPVQVQFKLDEWSSKRLNVALPPPVVVEPEPGRLSIPIDIQTPFENGYIDRVDQLSINVTRVWVDDPEFQENLGSFNATIETVGSYVPGPSAVAAVSAVALAAAVLRRRQ